MAKAKKKTEEKIEEKAPGKMIIANFEADKVLTEISNEARELYDQSRYGTPLDNGKIQLSLIEAFYLMDKGKIDIYKSKNKKFAHDEFVRKARKLEPNFWVKYCVFKDIRNRGYIIKTALKFGADFRVYDRGVKPGEDHARWIIFPVNEGSTLTWHEFAAKNRVAHSTKKRLLIGVVDEEGDVSYWEVRWMRP
ncbi:tRNA-intron lyase [Candidatus Woesearchaeota archaeon]|nr:tRNA-intron lyase [Candidatus Woesearchaeota archaeon]